MILARVARSGGFGVDCLQLNLVYSIGINSSNLNWPRLPEIVFVFERSTCCKGSFYDRSSFRISFKQKLEICLELEHERNYVKTMFKLIHAFSVQTGFSSKGLGNIRD